MALIYNATFDKNTRKLSFEDRAGNEIYSFTVPERAPAVDDLTKPLTFRSTQDGSTVSLQKWGPDYNSYQVSFNGGNTWVNYTMGTDITLNNGDEVSFRVSAYTAPNGNRYHFFKMTGKIEAWHNVMSMTERGESAMQEPIRAFEFQYMFKNCQSLTKAPALPETTLASYCYKGMFSGCQSLTKAPELPATTLANGCYNSMFSICQSLTKAPELPATTLSGYCYCYMFENCQSLTKEPELPATTLADSCYGGMFSGCQSLTKAPELPATTLSGYCYTRMFSGCQSLKEVRVSATTTETGTLTDWLSGVSATGDFYCDPNATIFPTGTSGIPENWRRLNINDYPN